MRNGFRVYDADTHVNPSAEILERYLDPSFRPRLAELAPYRHDTGDGLHSYSFGRKFYRRVLGEAVPRETLHRPRIALAWQQDAASRGAGCRGRQSCLGHGRGGDGRTFPSAARQIVSSLG